MENFNLIDAPWIPVRWRTSTTADTPSMVSLHDAFTRGTEIADLDCAPHERIALTRLLVCITHAALGAPENEDEWDGFGGNWAEAIPIYLKRDDIYTHFNLLGDGPRFLQTIVDTSEATVPTSKLFPALATNNNPTLLDHYGAFDTRNFSNATVALALLTFQNFYPPFKTGQPQGPCSKNSPLHSILIGENLKETIILNSLDKETIDAKYAGMGKPTWEEQNNAKSLYTYLNHLVPKHRKLWLKNSKEGFYHTTENGGIKYPSFKDGFMMPSVTTITNKKDERYLLKARIERSIWRDLHSLTNLNRCKTGNGFSSEVPLILKSHVAAMMSQKARLWTGTLITNESKIEIETESTFTIPQKLFTTDGQNTYAAGIQYSEFISYKLASALSIYWKEVTNAGTKASAPARDFALRQFWHSLDLQHGQLIQLSSNPQDRVGKPSIGAEGAEDGWTQLVRDAAKKAFNAVCPRSTPRQIRAYSKGIESLLWALNPRSKSTKSSTKNPAKKLN